MWSLKFCPTRIGCLFFLIVPVGTIIFGIVIDFGYSIEFIALLSFLYIITANILIIIFKATVSGRLPRTEFFRDPRAGVRSYRSLSFRILRNRRK